MARQEQSGTPLASGQHAAETSGTVPLISEGELCLDLINSEHFDCLGRKESRDTLEYPEWVHAFSEHWHLPVTTAPDAFALAALRVLRALLRSMLEAVVVGQPISDAQLEELNVFLALTPMREHVERTGSSVRLQRVGLQMGWTAVLTLVAISWVEVLARTPDVRLKVCANPDCHWVFVDQSHNQSRRWCRQWACGNMMKVRQFRAKHSQAHGRTLSVEEGSL